MRRHLNGYIVEGPDIIDIDLWRRRLKADRLDCERRKRILTNSLESIKQERRVLESTQE